MKPKPTKPTAILSVEQDDDYGIILTFSDGTTAAYLIEELLELRPHRERAPLKAARPS